MKHLTVKEKEQGAFEKMKGIFHYKNTMAAPKLKKVVLNVGGTADYLEKGVKLLRLLTEREPAKMQSKKRTANC